MNVLLVNPFFNGQAEIPPLGLAAVAGSLPDRGIGVEIVDLDLAPSSLEGLSLLRERIAGSRPRILGVTALTNSFPSAVKVFRTAKDADPGLFTVLGGVHGTVLHEAILERHETIDAVVRGEGEESFPDLVQAIFRERSLEGIAGVSFRGPRGVVCGPERPPVPDLDALHLPAHHLLGNACYRTQSLSSSRGCPHRCTFCSIRSLYGGSVRMRSAGSLVEEIRLLIGGGAKRIMFTDDNFTVDGRRIRELCAAMTGGGLNRGAAYYAQGRIDDLCRTPLLAGMLREAGFRALYIGAESGSQEILDSYRKGIHPEDVLRGVSLCVEQDLTPVVNFILLGPLDTPETVVETIRLAKMIFESGAEIAYTEAVIPYPGTPLREELERDGLLRETGGTEHFAPRRGLEPERFFLLCDLARDMNRLVHGGDPLYETRRVYYDLAFLEFLLHRENPPAFTELCRATRPDDPSETAREIRLLERRVRDAV
ncbi:MAG: B12-binding domain-containing radical SAM protein [Syntrophaceae bacterium]|nr:B12-binding domain-containing radical SAM protein [Syntrophaceae bacterium]